MRYLRDHCNSAEESPGQLVGKAGGFPTLQGPRKARVCSLPVLCVEAKVCTKWPSDKGLALSFHLPTLDTSVEGFQWAGRLEWRMTSSPFTWES